MSVRYYVASIVQNDRGMNLSKVETYIAFAQENEVVMKVSNVMPNPRVPWCISEVNTEQIVHDALQADADITLIPFFDNIGNYLPLTATVADLDADNRQTIAAFLRARQVDLSWVTGSTRLGAILKHAAQTILVYRALGDRFPELDLDDTVQQIRAQKRQQILAWMNVKNIPTGDITLQWTVRQVIARIIVENGMPFERLGTALL